MADVRSPTSTSPSTDNDDSNRAIKRRTFSCPHSGCNKSFGRRDYLERHAANHMISRPFSCPSCSKSFARADVLKRHILNHPRRRTASIGLAYAQDIMTSPGTESLSTTGSTQDSSPTSFFTQMETISAVRGDYSTPGSVVQQASEVDLVAGPLAPETLAYPAETSTEVDLTAGFSLDDLYTWFLSCDPATGDPALAADVAVVQPETTIPLAAITLPQPSEGSELTDEDDSDELIGLGMWRRIKDFCQDTLHSALPAEGFSLNDMNMYIDLYFLHFDPLYPILHRPTLKLRSPSPSLFLAMISIGSAYSSDTSTSDALLLIHRKLRSYLLEVWQDCLARADVQVLEDSSRPAMADLQTMLLSSYLGRMYGTSKYQDANQVFHAACVTAARLSGIFDVKVPRSDPSEEAGLGAWCLWADAEESVRAAWMVFASDVSNAMMSGYGLTVQSFTITSPLPCNDRRWSADTLAGWGETHDASQTEFPDIMRHLLDEATLPNGLSSFGHWIVLHGLMSLTWSLGTRGADTLTLTTPDQVVSWKSTVFRALAYWHQSAMYQLSRVTDPSSLPHFYAGIPLCSVCIIMLLTDVETILVFAGMSRIAGRDVTIEERKDARKRLEVWAHTSEARQSCWFALELLRVVFRWTGEAKAQLLPPSTLWCSYVGTVTIWAYQTIVENLKVCVKRNDISHPFQRCRVEPTLARHASLNYCERMLSCANPVNLPAIISTSHCIAIVAYMAHLCGEVRWGMISGPTNVLYQLLKQIETQRKNFVSC